MEAPGTHFSLMHGTTYDFEAKEATGEAQSHELTSITNALFSLIRSQVTLQNLIFRNEAPTENEENFLLLATFDLQKLQLSLF